MPRLRERSASLEIIPPTNTRAPGLADVMAAAFHANHRENEASDSRNMDEEEDADAEADEIEDELAPQNSRGEPANVSSSPLYCALSLHCLMSPNRKRLHRRVQRAANAVSARTSHAEARSGSGARIASA